MSTYFFNLAILRPQQNNSTEQYTYIESFDTESFHTETSKFVYCECCMFVCGLENKLHFSHCVHRTAYTPPPSPSSSVVWILFELYGRSVRLLSSWAIEINYEIAWVPISPILLAVYMYIATHTQHVPINCKHWRIHTQTHTLTIYPLLRNSYNSIYIIIHINTRALTPCSILYSLLVWVIRCLRTSYVNDDCRSFHYESQTKLNSNTSES